VVYFEALVTVDAENRGRKEESIDDVVVCMAAMMIYDNRKEDSAVSIRKSPSGLSKFNVRLRQFLSFSEVAAGDQLSNLKAA
jgi:hypothetical protein